MPKYFFHPSAMTGETVTLEGETAHHLIHVLRSTEGDALILCDGQLTDYRAEITKIEKNRLQCRVFAQEKCLTEPHTGVTVYQAIPKSDKLELIVQKCVELGAVEIVPVVTSRSIIRKIDAKKTSRYQKIAEASASQSMRGIIPSVHTAILFKQIIDKLRDQPTIVAYEKEKQETLKNAINHVKSQQNSAKLNIFIGPEGGISDDEAEMLASIGAKFVTLGPRILRTETAAIVMLAQINCLLE